ncbi:MAG: M48 family metallopeptidase [Thermodesulfobacteriota bacterium]|nr:M48 family metallopeptidase [Thermodesulfobacteriota bacterium]
MKYTPRQPESNVNVTPTSPLREFFLLTAGLVGFVILIYIVLGLAVDLIVPRISTDLENKMGRLFIRSIEAKYTDSERRSYIRSLLEDLQERCAQLPYLVKVHIRQASTVNAAALPGGHIIVYTGLLDKVASENELAFVLAHEMGHFAHRDHLRGMGRAFVFITISTLLFGTDSSISKMLVHGLNITEMSFSRKQETRADEFALEALHCDYGHVAGATDFFEKLSKEEGPGKFGHYFASHPESRNRISHLENIIRSREFKLGKRKPLPETWRQLKD